ncbi:hypothetical protein evm_009396 [Chilo suppressalis]|nr:hypothetical protein evm_009396 [Chilo suppressalis]
MIKNVFRLSTFCRASRSTRWFSSKLEQNENQPIKFTDSPASRKTAIPVIRAPGPNPVPWYQPFSVVTSVAVFLIYFCILREESDIDQEFDKTLYDRIKGLEKEQLIQSYKFNKEQGKSVEAIEQRLKELEAQEQKIVA